VVLVGGEAPAACGVMIVNDAVQVGRKGGRGGGREVGRWRVKGGAHDLVNSHHASSIGFHPLPPPSLSLPPFLPPSLPPSLPPRSTWSSGGWWMRPRRWLSWRNSSDRSSSEGRLLPGRWRSLVTRRRCASSRPPSLPSSLPPSFPRPLAPLFFPFSCLFAVLRRLGRSHDRHGPPSLPPFPPGARRHSREQYRQSRSPADREKQYFGRDRTLQEVGA